MKTKTNEIEKQKTNTKMKNKMKTKMKNKMKTTTKIKIKMNFRFGFFFCFLKVFAFLFTPRCLVVPDGQLSLDWPRSAIAFLSRNMATSLIQIYRIQ